MTTPAVAQSATNPQKPLNFKCIVQTVQTRTYWLGLRNRLKYELALFIRSIPHLIPKLILLQWGAMFLFRNLAYVRHVQGERLPDLGFELIAESHDDSLSEVNLYVNFFTTLLVTFMPLLSPHAHTNGVFALDIYYKVVNVACVGHILRFLTYVSTSLPGPAAHCQAGAPLYLDHLTLREIFTRRSRVHVDPNCGDLIFSGHMFQVTSFMVVILANMKRLVPNKELANAFSAILIGTVLIQPYFIIANRNHYTVDVVVASYVAPLLWYALEGFYKTQFYKYGVGVCDRYVPKYIHDYLKDKNPVDHAPMIPQRFFIDDDVKGIMEKYDMSLEDLYILIERCQSLSLSAGDIPISPRVEP